MYSKTCYGPHESAFVSDSNQIRVHSSNWFGPYAFADQPRVFDMGVEMVNRNFSSQLKCRGFEDFFPEKESHLCESGKNKFYFGQC